MTTRRYILRRLDDGWYVWDRRLNDAIEGYGTNRRGAWYAVCFYNYREHGGTWKEATR